MPIDKQKIGTPVKPFTPTLSTAYRPSKSPLTPKLAGSKNVSPISPSRRIPRSESTAAPPSRREDCRSPTTSKLSGNVTPRSGARVSRIGGDSPSTPGSTHTGTSSKTRPLSAIEISKSRRYNGTGAGLGIETGESKQRSPLVAPDVDRVGVSTGNLGRRVSTGSPRNAAANSLPPRLFADRNAQSSLPSEFEEIPRTEKPPTFFYASDAAKPTDSPEPLRTTPSALEDEKGKLYYANSKLDDQSPPSRNPTMAVNAGPAAISFPYPQPHSTQSALRDLLQPSPPTKAASLRSAPAALSSASANSVKSRMTDGSVKPRTPVMPSNAARRASTSSKTSTVRQTDQRKLSVASSAPSTPRKKVALQISPKAIKSQDVTGQIVIPQSPTERFSPRSTSLSSSNTGVSIQTLDSTPSNSRHPLSPVKNETPQSSQLQRTNELAANARRERKVLDLEISNSSLLAINRTLEREMRKQSVELRRFRRLSRCSGRQSLATNSMRSLSGQSELSTFPASEDGDCQYGNLSDLEEMSSSDLEEDDMDSFFDDDSSLLSPTSHTAHDTRHSTRDEKRLMLDLSKHRQLLIDSQKMNQSIKRCLNWTEELINEGKKALEYHVKVSDVEVGGKVLARDPNDEEDARGGRKPLLSPGLDVPTPPAVQQGRRLWRLGLEEMEMEVDRMLESSTTLKEVVPA